MALGLLTEFLLHYFLNFPIILARLDVGHLGPAGWQLVLFMYVNIYWVFMLGLLGYFVYGKKMNFGRGPARARCPGCKEVYDRPFFRVNLGLTTSYERCTKCRKYHKIEAENLVDPTALPAGDGAAKS